ncbi:MAG TPA: exodeoxyribonuclease V subunit gamma [Nocardia sp.]|uniref:exodeoxyribonuclease V subunit gamma n=1 Tax=Nocardia sp. TaxID=1821 RepID=UPI002B4B21BF|nr:exodeoxyribonuclease V subunit gamma [Nocardia sp.]HLS79129.1 exodeoxyribonuclease V subunit gamma [Nocardia sp.]
MPLHIHRAERADTLVDALAARSSVPQADPFAPEVIAVPAKGVERWLTQRLSGTLGASEGGSDGVAANIAFPAPAALVTGVLAACTGIDPERDPWSRDRLVWPVLRALDRAVTEPWCAVPARYLGAASDGRDHRVGRRYATAAHLAALFDSYGAQRPELILDWAAGGDGDGAGGRVPEDLAWQPRLWRMVREEIGVPAPAERLADACARLRAEPGLVDLPDRLSLFGVTRLATDQLAVLAALAAHREVHLWLVHPSPVMWRALAARPPARTRAADTSAAAVRHPLLAGLAREVRELQQRLTVLAVPEDDDGYLPPSSPAEPSLLRALQAGLREDVWPPAERVAADGTVEVHACHGPARQVEVLRERLLALFAADHTLEPRDVLVMCPEVETFAPLVRAAFGTPGAGEPGEQTHPAQQLRVRLADRGRGVTNPLLAVARTLLELADGRVTVTQVLDLAASETVRRRCGFDDDAIERLREWAVASGARWGIGARQRQAFGLADFAQNTLNGAVDRILLGVTADESGDDWLDLALPLADVDSNDVDLAGRFAEFVDRLAVCLRDLRGPRPAREWAHVLGRALDLLTDVPDHQAWLRTEARAEIAAATGCAGGDELDGVTPAGAGEAGPGAGPGPDVPLRLADVTVLFTERLAARPTRANFRTGELTVCTMVPMRSVPHRVVVLLGLDDDVFPRAGGVDGDDVLAREPLPGERDARGEDRQLLLDAVCAAGERLLIFHSGADPVTGSPRPPAIPVAELLDAVRAHVGEAATGEVVTRHPLQSFDRRNFDPARPRSFDSVALAGARAAAAPARPAPPLLSEPLPAPERGDVALSDLISFAEHPIRGFLWQRLGLRVPEHEEDIAENLPIELDGLAKWEVGERMLIARLNGADPAALRQAEWRRGTLPPFQLGARVLEEIESTVETLVRAAAPDYAAEPHAVDISVDLGDGRRLVGTVPEVRGDALVRATYSQVKPRHRIAAWVGLLALVAAEDRPWRAVTTGRGGWRRPAWRCELAAPDRPEAIDLLRDLVRLRDQGLTEPLPLTPTASAAYAERRARGDSTDDALLAAEREFNGKADGFAAFGDHTDRHLRYVLGPAPRLDHLLTTPAPAGTAGEPTRFGALAVRLWTPLLAAETQRQP